MLLHCSRSAVVGLFYLFKMVRFDSHRDRRRCFFKCGSILTATVAGVFSSAVRFSTADVPTFDSHRDRRRCFPFLKCGSILDRGRSDVLCELIQLIKIIHVKGAPPEYKETPLSLSVLNVPHPRRQEGLSHRRSVIYTVIDFGFEVPLF